MDDKFARAIKERRTGSFRVSCDSLIKGADRLMSNLFNRVLIVDADMNYIGNYVTYKGYSPDWPPVDKEITEPEYIAEFQSHYSEGGEIASSFIGWKKWDSITQKYVLIEKEG